MADFDYNEQQAMTNLNILPSQFEDEDYFRLNEILAAKSPDDRLMTGREFADKYGPKGGLK